MEESSARRMTITEYVLVEAVLAEAVVIGLVLMGCFWPVRFYGFPD